VTAPPASSPVPGTGSGEDPYAGIPERPVVRLVLRDDGSGTVNGQVVAVPPNADRHRVLMTRACRIAATLGHPVRVTARDATTAWELIAHPDGGVTPVGRGRPATPSSTPPPPSTRPPTSQPPSTRPPTPPPPSTRPPTPPPVSTRPPSTERATTPTVTPRPATMPGAVVWSTRRPRSLRSLSFPLLGGIAAGALLLAALVVGLPGGTPAAEQVVPTASASARVTSQGKWSGGTVRGAPGRPASTAVVTALEAVGPPSFQAKPAWAVPIAAWTKSVAADGGTVLTRDPDGRLLLLDPGTGQVRWRSSTLTRPSRDGPWLTHVDGRPVAALVGDGVLSYWPLPASPTVTVPQEVSVLLPADVKVTWIGSAPLVTSPGGGAGVIRSGAYRSVALPAGARALATDGSTVLAVTGTAFVRQAVGQPPAQLRDLPRPKGAGARPIRVEAVGMDLLLTVWPPSAGRGQIAAVVDISGGAVVIQTTLEAGVDLTRAGVVRETAGTQTLLGSVLVDTYTKNLNVLDPRYRVWGVARGHAWALLDGRMTDIHLSRRGDFRLEPFAAGEPAVPIGVVAAAGLRPETAVVVAPSGDGWLLAGLRGTAPKAT
jgi:hypothetical protein